jgi:hypothetical protein
MSSRKFLTITLPALAAAALLVMAGIEVWVRLTVDPTRGTPGFFLSDPVRGQRLAANYSGWFAGVPVHINSLELRDDREYELRKGPRTFRILVLGDSVTFGHGSVNEHTYPSILEQMMRRWRPDVDWQVWNAGVPGYNTTQELAHLLEVGPKFKPDLVVVGFYDNDLTDNYTIPTPGVGARLWSDALSFAKRHVYSLEFYKRVYLTARWRLSASNVYRQRIDHLGTEDALLERASQVANLKEQQLTNYARLADDQIVNPCPQGQKPNPEDLVALQHDPGYPAWIEAVRGLQRLHAQGTYRIVFFLNVIPPVCPDQEHFYDGGVAQENALFLRIMGEGTPAVSAYDAFLHRLPAEMPMAVAHAIGNANHTKAEVLFEYLRDHLLPSLLPPSP